MVSLPPFFRKFNTTQSGQSDRRPLAASSNIDSPSPSLLLLISMLTEVSSQLCFQLNKGADGVDGFVAVLSLNGDSATRVPPQSNLLRLPPPLPSG
jgi:hypothetical protein